MSARTAILGRVRGALADVPPGEPAGPSGGPVRRRSIADPVALFAQRVADYRATVVQCAPDAVAAAVADRCAAHGARGLVAAPGVPAGWRPGGVDVVEDAPPLAAARLDVVDGVLTGAAAAIAETGTILLDAGPVCGRRALTLVPDLHVCVVRAEQVVRHVPDGLAAVGDAIAAGRAVTLVSGPSATSDIELSRVEGVHGPRRLEVVIVT